MAVLGPVLMGKTQVKPNKSKVVRSYHLVHNRKKYEKIRVMLGDAGIVGGVPVNISRLDEYANGVLFRFRRLPVDQR